MPSFKKLILSGSNAALNSLVVTQEVYSSNFRTTSDKRLKSEIIPISNALNTLKKVISYEYIKNGKQDAGFIAQEIKKIIPYSVEKDRKGYYTLNTLPILAYIHKALLELEERVSLIEKKLK